MKAVGYNKGRPFELKLWPIGGGFHLAPRAAGAFLAMREKAKESGVELKVNTAFRTFEEQKALRDKYERYLTDLARYAKGEIKTKPGGVAVAAKPGYSNHQQGLSVDINRAPGDDPKTKAPDSPIDLWLQANAPAFGFINDVPGEPWHWTWLEDKLVAALKAA